MDNFLNKLSFFDMIKKNVENCCKRFCDLDFELNSFLNRTKTNYFYTAGYEVWGI